MSIITLKNSNYQLEIFAQKPRAITVTPISHDYKAGSGNPSKENYEHELEQAAKGYNQMWTDAPENHSRVGDLFAYVVGAGTKKSKPCYADVHQIVAVLPQDCRRTTGWGRGNNANKPTDYFRNVLVLGPRLVRAEWEDFITPIMTATGKWSKYVTKPNGDMNDPQRHPIQRTQSIILNR